MLHRFTYALLAAATTSIVCVPVTAQTASAQASASGYNQPPKNILDVMQAPSPPTPLVSPTHDRILLVTRQEYPKITQVAAPFLRLAACRTQRFKKSASFNFA